MVKQLPSLKYQMHFYFLISRKLLNLFNIQGKFLIYLLVLIIKVNLIHINIGELIIIVKTLKLNIFDGYQIMKKII